MKVIILNGSPKAQGNTATALHEAERDTRRRRHITMRQLGLSTAFLIKSIQLGIKAFGSPKIKESMTETHHIRQ